MPRSSLFNQANLIALRKLSGVHTLVSASTSWAQINGRDEITAPEKVKLDVFYLQNQTILMDIKIILLTALKVLKRENVTH